MKIIQLEIQLSNTKQEKDDKFKTMRKIIDSKDTELKFQVSNCLQQSLKTSNLIIYLFIETRIDCSKK